MLGSVGRIAGRAVSFAGRFGRVPRRADAQAMWGRLGDRLRHGHRTCHVGRIGAARAAYRRLRGVAAGAKVVEWFHLCE